MKKTSPSNLLPDAPDVHRTSSSMEVMIRVSLILNLLVLVPVCLGILFFPAWAERGFGEVTPARGILLAIYAAIAVASALLLFTRDPRQVAVLLLVQVIYKVLTPFTVGSVANPVVPSNLGVTVVHLVTLILIWRVTGISKPNPVTACGLRPERPFPL